MAENAPNTKNMSITKERIGDELYVWIWERGIKSLLYKRWISRGYGMVMCRQPFTTRDTEKFNEGSIN